MARLLLVIALAFGATLGAIALFGGDEPAPRTPAAAAGVGLAGRAPAGRDAAARVTRLEAAVRADPRSAGPRVALAGALLQRARETGNPSFHDRAGAALAAALARRPGDPGALVERAVLRLVRHDFRGALADARRARAAAPEAVRPLGVLVDALVELGRMRAAERALQTMIDRKPTADAYARASYLRELRGDLPGARRAMRLAVSAGSGLPEGDATMLALLGDLELAAGRRGPARRAYGAALARFPGHRPAVLGLARADLAAGAPERAVRRLRPVVARTPQIDHLVALGEAERLAGRPGAARRELALARAQLRLLEAGGASADAEPVLTEADHGDPRRAVAMARRAWRAAPSGRSADALGWALTRAGRPLEGLRWARRALASGSRDPVRLLHAGLAARAAGRPREAAPLLRAGLEGGRGLAPLLAREAARALEAAA